jgi:predicted RNase H-like HicB family nuclease
MLLEYVEAAMRTATYEKLADGTYCGKIKKCRGAVAFGRSLYGCQEELRSVLEDWLIVKLRHNDTIPSIGGVNLNHRIPRTATASSRG